MDKSRRKEILSQGRPGPYWPAEPMLGGWYTDEEVEAATISIRESMDPTTVGFGFICPEILEFEEGFARYCGAEEAVSINGAGTGLDMAIMCLDLEPGDEVIVPAINFRAAAMAVVGQGGRVVWSEVDPRTFNMDPADVEKRITPRTRAIFPVHMNGLSAPMDDLLEIAERHPHPKHGPLKVIGDAARAGAGGYKGTKIGAKGWMTVFSFHTMKLMTTLGEGGAITTDDAEAARRLRGIRQFGGAHDGWGTNYKMTKVQAAVGLVQLRRLDEMTAQRVQAAKRRNQLLQGIPELTLPYEPEGYEHTYYLYTMLVPRAWAGEKRDQLLRMMEEEYGVGCGVYNRPVYEDSGYLRKETEGQKLPLSDELSTRLFCMALHPLMTEEEQAYMAAALWDVVEQIRSGG